MRLIIGRWSVHLADLLLMLLTKVGTLELLLQLNLLLLLMEQRVLITGRRSTSAGRCTAQRRQQADRGASSCGGAECVLGWRRRAHKDRAPLIGDWRSHAAKVMVMGASS